MKFNALSQINNPGSEIVPGVAPGGLPGDDWLSRINTTIANFKELLKIAQQFKGEPKAGTETVNSGGPNSTPPGGLTKASVSKFLDLLVQQGYGNLTINTILEKAGPLTIQQIAELVKRA